MNVKRILATVMAISVVTALTCADDDSLQNHSDAGHSSAPHSGAGHSFAPHSDAWHPDADHGAAPLPERVAEAIEHYVRAIEKAEVAFSVQDEGAGGTVLLGLETVRSSPVYRIGPDEYSAGAVFVSDKGTIYDLDFSLKPVGHALPKVIHVNIREVNGVPRYTWREKDGLWVRDSVP